MLTDRVKKLMESAKDIEKLAQTHLLGLGLPEHMAETAVYLASDEFGDHHRASDFRR